MKDPADWWKDEPDDKDRDAVLDALTRKVNALLHWDRLAKVDAPASVRLIALALGLSLDRNQGMDGE